MGQELGLLDRLLKKMCCRVCHKAIEQPEDGNVVWEVKCRNPHYQYSWVHKACTHTLDQMTLQERGELLDAWEMERFLRPETDMYLPHVKVPWKKTVIRILQKRWGRREKKPRLQRTASPSPTKKPKVTPRISRERQRSLSSRFAIMQRDEFRCRLCGVAASDGPHIRLEIDHITPRSKGGNDDAANLWTLCFSCNRGKGARTL